MIKNRQELSGITAKLNARYGTSVEEDGAVSHMDWEIQRRTSGTGVKNRSITRFISRFGVAFHLVPAGRAPVR